MIEFGGLSQYEREHATVTMGWRDIQSIAQSSAREMFNQMMPHEQVGHEAFRVPNDWRGRVVLWLIRRFLNRKVWRLGIMGRKGIKGIRYSYNIPRSDARELAVYLYRKR